MKKKNRSTKLLLLLLVLIVAVASVLIAKKVNEKREKEEAEATTVDESFIVYEASGVQKIAYTTKDGYEAEFEKEGNTWYVVGDHDFPVRQNLVKAIEDAVQKIESPKQYTDLEEDITGFREPKYVLNLTDSQGTVTLTAGNETKVHGTYYSMNGDGTVYLTEKTIYENCDHALADFMEYDEIPTFIYGKALDVVAAEKNIHVDLTDTESYDDYLFEMLLEELQDVEWLGCATYTASKADLEDYGLKDPELSVTLTYGSTGAQKFTLEFGKTTDESGKYRFARIEGSENVYLTYSQYYDDFDFEFIDGKPVYPTEAEEAPETEESSSEIEDEASEEASGDE